MGAGALVAVLLVALDQATKYFAEACLSGGRSISVIPGVFQLFYLENRGAAFGMLADRQWFFILVAFVMMAAALWVYLRLPQGRRYRLLGWICVLVGAGAAGNMIDRIWHKYVIDFLYVSLIDFPVFNLADCYVCIGAALGVLSVFTVYREEDFSFLLPGRGRREEEGNE